MRNANIVLGTHVAIPDSVATTTTPISIPTVASIIKDVITTTTARGAINKTSYDIPTTTTIPTVPTTTDRKYFVVFLMLKNNRNLHVLTCLSILKFVLKLNISWQYFVSEDLALSANECEPKKFSIIYEDKFTQFGLHERQN